MTGSIARIKGLILQEFYITKRSLELFFDILIFPLINVALFGLIARFFHESALSIDSHYLILGILLWEIIAINQYNLTVSSLWSVWSHNLTNIFIAPISVPEYVIAHIISALLRTVLIFILLALGTYSFFDFNVLHIGLANLVLCFVNLSLFAWWLGIILLGFIFRFGTRIQAISWGLIFIFQPLTASYFPLSILPSAVQFIAHFLPPTYVFEAARQALNSGRINWHNMGLSFAMNIGYSLIAAFVFKRLFIRSKDTGQFARNDT